MKFEDEARPTIASSDLVATAVKLSETGDSQGARGAIDQYLARADPRDVSRLLIDAALRGDNNDQHLLQVVASAVDDPDLRLVGRMSDAIQRAFKPGR